jgi:bacterioferritin
VCKNWGFHRIAEVDYKESIDEMKHADKLVERILFLEGIPNLQKLGRVRVGQTIPEQLALDLDLEREAVVRLNKGIELCVDEGDNTSRDLLEEILESEEEHLDWLETQLGLIKQLGEKPYLFESRCGVARPGRRLRGLTATCKPAENRSGWRTALRGGPWPRWIGTRRRLTATADIAHISDHLPLGVHRRERRAAELYAKGEQRQWDADTRIDWSLDLDPENPEQLPDESIFGSDVFERLEDRRRRPAHFRLAALAVPPRRAGRARLHREIVRNCRAWTQGYAATQVIDEARHVEAYLLCDEFGCYPITPTLSVSTGLGLRWDMTYLGMQVLIEGLALAAASADPRPSPSRSRRR